MVQGPSPRNTAGFSSVDVKKMSRTASNVIRRQQPICAKLSEIASEQPFDRFLKQRLFDPLGMEDTGLVATEDLAQRWKSV